MFEKFKTNTLVLIAIASAFLFPFTTLVAYPVVQGLIWLEWRIGWRFSPDAYIYIFYVIAVLVALITIVCGTFALRSLYKRYRAGSSPKRPLIGAATFVGFSLLLSFLMNVYVPLTISW